MMTYLGDLVNALMSLFPSLILVRSTHGGIKFRRGRKPLLMRPGAHFYWPLLTEIEVIPMKRQTKRMDPQYLTTLDNVTVGVRGLVTYEVGDLVKMMTACWDYDEVTEDTAQAVIREVITGVKYEELSGIEKSLQDKVSQRLEEFGVRVLNVSLTDQARCRVIGFLVHGPPAHPGPQDLGQF